MRDDVDSRDGRTLEGLIFQHRNLEFQLNQGIIKRSKVNYSKFKKIKSKLKALGVDTI